MKLTFSDDAMGDGPDAAHLVFYRLKGIQFTVHLPDQKIGDGLILKDVGYHDSDSVYLSFVQLEDFLKENVEDDFYIVLAPENNYGENLSLEYC